MKRFLFSAAFAAAVICSCQKQDAEQADAVEAAQEEITVGFSTYTSATKSTVVTADTVQNRGFGVFAFYQGQAKLADYSLANYLPNFMYNQKVTKSGNAWTYSPVKYWPNTDGAYVSFFAYAPYVDSLSLDKHTVTPQSNQYLSSSSATPEGLRLILSYDKNGPAIEYNVNYADTTKGFDLLWGQAKGSQYAPVDEKKPDVKDSIKFNFKHALSRLDFSVQVLTDTTAAGDKNQAIAAGTTVKIKSVTLEGNFMNQGILRLYDGQWSFSNSVEAKSVVLDTAQFTKKIKDGISGDETKTDSLALLAGVNKTVTSGTTVEATKNNYLMLIPGATFYIKIVYDVVTTDSNNNKNSSTITNTVVSKDKYTLEQGKAYKFNLKIGLTSVKFKADISDWDAESSNLVNIPANTNS